MLLCTHVPSCSAQYIPITSERNTGRFLKVIMSTWKLQLLNVWGLFILCLSLLPLRKPLVFPHLLGKWIHSDVKKKKIVNVFLLDAVGTENEGQEEILPCLLYSLVSLTLTWIGYFCHVFLKSEISFPHITVLQGERWWAPAADKVENYQGVCFWWVTFGKSAVLQVW